jgi:hypothetical protein
MTVELSDSVTMELWVPEEYSKQWIANSRSQEVVEQSLFKAVAISVGRLQGVALATLKSATIAMATGRQELTTGDSVK